MEKHHFGHETARHRQRGDRLIPGIAGFLLERAAIEVDAARRLLIGARRDIYRGIGERRVPFGYPPVVQAIGAYDPARRALALDLGLEAGHEGRRRMQEEIAVQANDGHPRRKRHLGPGHAKANDGAIDDPDVVANPFQGVERRVGASVRHQPQSHCCCGSGWLHPFFSASKKEANTLRMVLSPISRVMNTTRLLRSSPSGQASSVAGGWKTCCTPWITTGLSVSLTFRMPFMRSRSGPR